jgi:hypothetical protein
MYGVLVPVIPFPVTGINPSFTFQIVVGMIGSRGRISFRSPRRNRVLLQIDFNIPRAEWLTAFISAALL